jgi:hypothetical protein
MRENAEHPAKYEHQAYVCRHMQYELGSCMFCDGSVYACNICGGIEGGMPASCPGRMMTADEICGVRDGKLDFVNGKWMDLKEAMCLTKS